MVPWTIYAGGALLLTAVGFGTGWQVREWKADSDELEAVEDAITRGKEQQELADFKAGRYEDQRNDAQIAAENRQTEIRTIYRTNEIVVPAECEPPADVLSVLDRGIGYANAQVAGQPGAEVPTNTGKTDPVH
jgi:hypothetical protein